MSSNHSFRRLGISTLGAMLVFALGSSALRAQYTYVQDNDNVGFWDDVLNWDTDNNSGTPNTTFPNGIGVTAQINQPIWSGAAGGYTLDMPATDVTVGTLTIDNTNDDYLTRITMVNHNGRLVFEDASGTAKWIETLNTSDAPQNVQNTIGMPILVKGTLEFTANNYPNLNTGTIFQNRFDGDANSKIVKKGIGGIQFNLNSDPGATAGFFGTIEIQEGAIRLINKSFSVAKVSGMTVSSGGQLQLADNAATAVTDYGMATGAILNINGPGTSAPSSGPQGALRFGITGGRTTTFHNPVVLQTDSTIAVGAVNSIGVIDQPVSGAGSLTKQGDGKLVLSSTSNSWTGDTTVLSGATVANVLSLAGPTLADGRDVYLSATRTALDLTFAATDSIRSLYFDGVAQATGIWGATGSGASHETSLITGTGKLNVVGLAPVGVQGDFDNNGVVDAADYVLWRNGGPLQNEMSDPGVTNAQDYIDWRSRFGSNTGSGSVANLSAVPEPAAFTLFTLVLGIVAATYRKR